MLKSVLFIFFLFSNNCFAETTSIVTIPLHYKTAQEVIAVIQPILPSDSAVNGKGQTLIVRSTPEGHKKIRSLLKAIDKMPKTVIISVWHAAKGINVQHKKLLRNIKVYQTTSHDDTSNVQRLRVMTGAMAFISTSQEIPELYAVDVGHKSIVAGVGHREIRKGLYVMPQLLKESAQLTLYNQRQYLNRFGQNTVDTKAMGTKVIVPLGEWVQLSSLVTESPRDERINVYETEDRMSYKSSLYIKVEIVK